MVVVIDFFIQIVIVPFFFKAEDLNPLPENVYIDYPFFFEN